MKKYEEVKLELPYNFDKELLIYYMNELDASRVRTIFMAPWLNDHESAKQNDYKGFNIRPEFYPGIYDLSTSSEEWYIRNVKLLASKFDVTILMQHPYQEISMEVIDKYVKYGVKGFMLSQDAVAKDIKLKYGDSISTRASICRKTQMCELLYDDLSMYDDIVLFFPFNRSLKAIEKIYDKFNLTILANCGCSTNCEGHFHWFASITSDTVSASRCKTYDEAHMQIASEDLSYFTPYCKTIKLQGRELSSATVIKALENTLYVLDNEIEPVHTREYYDAFPNNKYLKEERIIDKYYGFFDKFGNK